MKYKNAYKVLPEELLSLVQEYVQGEYIYVPVRDKHIEESYTDYKVELEKRDAHIYTKYLEAKKEEWNEFRSQVTDWEIEEYLYKF